jgi:hypothetical protein fuD12_02769
MYFYLNKENLLNGEVVIVFQTENQIHNYKEITNFGELVEFKGESIPAVWEYSETEDVMYNIEDKPSPYHILKNKKWIVEDKEGFREYCFNNIDNIKQEILEYGFDYEITNGDKHRQRCRDNDIAKMVATVVSLQLAKSLGLEQKVTWYFEDNVGMTVGLLELGKLMLFGTTFIQSIYDTENYFKTLKDIKKISKNEFEIKRKELHIKIVGGK